MILIRSSVRIKATLAVAVLETAEPSVNMKTLEECAKKGEGGGGGGRGMALLGQVRFLSRSACLSCLGLVVLFSRVSGEKEEKGHRFYVLVLGRV